MPHEEFPPVFKRPAEEKLVTLDFTARLGTTEVLSTTGTSVTIKRLDGTDVTATFLVANSLSIQSPSAQWKVTAGVDNDVLTMYLVVLTDTPFSQKFEIPIPLVVEAETALVVTFLAANSYVTLQQAQNYFNERLFTEAWESANGKSRERSLIMAAKMFNRLLFRGIKDDLDQTLAFPRSHTINDVGVVIVPQEVKDAQCEQALFLLQQGAAMQRRTAAQAQGVASYELGPGLGERFADHVAGGHVWYTIAPGARQLLAPHLEWGVDLARV